MKDQPHRFSRGQVLVYVAIAMVALLGCLALATDVAIFYFNWAQLRKETDAAALAGASYLPSDPSAATSTASDYVAINGKPSDQIVENSIGSQGTNNLPNSSITVTVRRIVPYYFARVVGLASAPVTVTAVAGVQPICGAKGWIPVAIPCTSSSCYDSSSPCTKNPDGTGCDYGCGDKLTLNIQQLVPGDWGPATCGSSNNGASDYVQALTDGCSTFMQVGDTMYSKPGNPVLTEQGIKARLNGSTCTSSAPSDTAAACGTNYTNASSPCLVLLPLVDTTQWNSGRSSPGTVYGFAAAWITGTSGNTLSVVLVNGTTSASASASPTCPQTGAFTPVLLQ